MIIVNREYLEGLLLLLLLLSLLLSLNGEAPMKRKKLRQKKKGKQEIEFQSSKQPSRRIGRFLLIAFEKVVTLLKFYSTHKWERSY